MRIRFAKFSPISSDPRLTHIMLPDDSTEAKVGVRELQGYVGEMAKKYRGVKKENLPWKGPRHGHTSCSPSARVYPAVVSDSVLNEPRVGFLSHPKTMCRTAPTIVSLPSVYLARSGSPCFVLSVVLRPLLVFCIRYCIPTTSVPVVFATRFLSPFCAGAGRGDHRKKGEKRPCECPFRNSYIFLYF